MQAGQEERQADFTLSSSHCQSRSRQRARKRRKQNRILWESLQQESKFCGTFGWLSQNPASHLCKAGRGAKYVRLASVSTRSSERADHARFFWENCTDAISSLNMKPHVAFGGMPARSP